jgi:hypothetical protein
LDDTSSSSHGVYVPINEELFLNICLHPIKIHWIRVLGEFQTCCFENALPLSHVCSLSYTTYESLSGILTDEDGKEEGTSGGWCQVSKIKLGSIGLLWKMASGPKKQSQKERQGLPWCWGDYQITIFPNCSNLRSATP